MIYKSADRLGRFLVLPESDQTFALRRIEVSQRLIDDIHSDHLVPRTDEPKRYRPRCTLANPGAVDGPDWNKSRARAREKSLLGVVKIERSKVTFDDFNAQLLGQFEDCRFSNTPQNVPVRRRAQLAIYNEEEIVRARFTQVPV